MLYESIKKKMQKCWTNLCDFSCRFFTNFKYIMNLSVSTLNVRLIKHLLKKFKRTIHGSNKYLWLDNLKGRRQIMRIFFCFPPKNN